MVNETWKRRRRERGRARRYDPMAEPVQLPPGFVGKIRGALQVAVSDLRTCLSWLDREIGIPMSEVSMTLHLNREYGKRGEPDADDIIADVWFDDPHGGRNYQRFTWVYSDEGRSTEGGVRNEEPKRRMERSAKPGAARVGDLEAAASAAPELEAGATGGGPCSSFLVLRSSDELEPVNAAEAAGGGGLSGVAELGVEAVGLVDVVTDVEERAGSVRCDEVREVVMPGAPLDVQNLVANADGFAGEDCALHDPESDAPTAGGGGVEMPVAPMDVQNPVANADRLAGGNCALHDSDSSAPMPKPAGSRESPCVAAGKWDRWRGNTGPPRIARVDS